MNTINIEQELAQNFIDFSHEANCQRAFADARDGLKPGQRACLWEMYVKGYLNNKPHVKSAKIAGGVIATWWPHSDAAIYDTFARMSQKWINNIPEIDWHGANGSIQISGEPAASRYTEARLSKAAEEGLLNNIKKHNVPMKLNFSEDEEWPQVFPALMPRLMINGCQGIGSTIANVWLPHSLQDLSNIIIEYINTGNINYSNLAPSFPTGGIIINKNNLHTIYETGKGKVILRGKAEIKNNSIVITEIPYQVYVEPLIEQIKELIKNEEITGINNIFNKSDKNRLLIEIECEKAPETVLVNLYNKTDLQKSYSANQFALVGKTPKLLALKDYLDIYLQHNYDCIKREHEFTLNKAKEKLEIVTGLIKALENIDNIIALIKSSESTSDAMHNLIIQYEFTENQAKAIVDMKLGRLAHLEKIELNKEQLELTSTINKNQEIVSNIKKQQAIYLERFTAFVKKYGDARRTELTNIELPKITKEKEEIIPEDCVVIATTTGEIKRVAASTFKPQTRAGKGVKTVGSPALASISTNTVDTLMLFSDQGKMYRVSVDKVPTGTNATIGGRISDLIALDPNEKIIAITSLYKHSSAKYVVFITKKGYFKKTLLEEYLNTKRTTGIVALKLNEGDSIATVIFCEDEEFILLSKDGMAIRFETKSIAPIGRVAMGVRAMKLNDTDEILTGLPIHKLTDNLAVFTDKGYAKKMLLDSFPLQMRNGKGVIAYHNNETSGNLIAAEMLGEGDNVLLTGRPNSICVSEKEITLSGRVAAGLMMIKGSVVTAVTKV